MNLKEVFIMFSTFFKTPFNLNLTRKICLSGIFVVLVVLLNKVIAINYIAFIPFVRLSFGSIAIIIFSSIVFGPLYGLVIGAMGDILGYFIFDASSFGWFPQITAIYALLGFIPFFIYKLVANIRNKKMMVTIEYSLFTVVTLLITFFFIFNDHLTLYGVTYEFNVWQRILFPSLVLILFGIVVVTNYFLDKKDKGMVLGVYQISFVVTICEILVNFLFGSLMKSLAFGFNMFAAILISQAVLMFFNIPYNSYLIFVIMKIGQPYLVKENE